MSLHRLIEEWDAGLRSRDPLGFPGYADRLSRLDGESIRAGRTEHYALVESRFEVLGGSMGSVAGEKIVRAFRRATDLRLPVVVVTATGGSRMQEGMLSLVQMARSAEAVRAHAAAGLLSLAYLRAPTTGGPYASYASLCDLRAAEPAATIGFAGPRVVADTLGAPLPADSHTAEFAHRHGLVDALVAVEEAAAWVEGALGLREIPLSARDLGSVPDREVPDGAWGEVVRARAPDRPSGIDWAATLCSSWTELRGLDPVVRAGLAMLAGRRVVVIACDRHERDGRPTPAAYRLARRAIRLAGRLGLPLVSLVDTPGADPGPDSEAGGIASEIARTFEAMADLSTPSVAVCVGEGGSGGALALAYADRLLLQEHAVFSVIAPEGAASILERDPSRAPEVAARLGLTAPELLRLGVVDEVVPERNGALAQAITAALDQAEPGARSTRFDTATTRWVE